MITRFLGNILVCAGGIFGIIGTGLMFSDGLHYILFMIIMAYPLYILGQWMRIGTRDFKVKYLRFTVAYFQFVILIPSMFILYADYLEIKGETLSRENYLWFQLTSSPDVAGWLTLVFIIFVVSVMPKIIFGWSYGGKKLTLFVVVMFLTFSSSLYVLWNDYRGIHETEGIVTSSWIGAGEQIKWEEIESVTMTPYVKKRSLNQHRFELLFTWEFSFVEADGSRTEFEKWGLSENGLNQSREVRDKIVEENIPLLFVEMDDKTRKYYELDLDIEKLDRAEFDEFFLQ